MVVRYQTDFDTGKLVRSEVLEVQHEDYSGRMLAIPRAKVRTAERHPWNKDLPRGEYWIPLSALVSK